MAPDTSPVTQAQPETVALFVSDLHLQEAMPRTAAAFFSFLQDHALTTQRLYLLGDLFEYWAGDDDLGTPFHLKVVQALRAVSDAGVEMYWISGNRDFLVGRQFAEAAGMQLLPDPYVLVAAGQRIVLTHGDAACTDDVNYMAFRNQVRNSAWQAAFLAQPLEARKKIIEGVRMGSREAQREKTARIMDVNAQAIAELFASSQASVMIHGHTHRPADHEHDGHRRHVLTDWDFDDPAGSGRGGWLALGADGRISRHAVAAPQETVP